MKKKELSFLLLLVASFLIIVLLHQSVSIFMNYFNNTMTTENLTFTGNQNFTRYLNIPLRANVTFAFMNFTGFVNLNATSSWCYQETANISTSCGGLSSGSYEVDGDGTFFTSTKNFYDGNTATYPNVFGSNHVINITYYKPSLATNSSLWYIWSDATPTPQILNIPSSCWNANASVVKMGAWATAAPSASYWGCYNSTALQQIAVGNGFALAEEAMNWSCGAYPSNPWLEIGVPDGVREWFLPNAELQSTNAILKQLNDSSSITNISFIQQRNQTVYLRIPKHAQIINASLNLTGFPNNLICYQESANTSNQGATDDSCGQIYTGNYSWSGIWSSPERAYDGNWTRDNWADPMGGGSHYLYINYTKPVAAIGGIWEVGYSDGVTNITIPDACWNYSSTVVALRISQISTNVNNETCFTGAGWPTLFTSDYMDIYEEAMIWNISFYPSNVSLSLNSQIWNSSGFFNLTNVRTTDFASQLSSSLSSCIASADNLCDINMTAISYTTGILQVSDILINYTNVSRTLNLATSLNRAINNTKCSGGSVYANNCSIPFTLHSDSAGFLQYLGLNITYYTTPNITLTLPQNYSASGEYKNFTCNFTDDTLLKNITLVIWNSTGLYNQTWQNITGYSNFSYTLINFTKTDTYYWTCKAFNTEGYSSYTDNYTLLVDIANAATTLNAPSNNRWLNYNTNIGFNCTSEGDYLDSGFLFGNFTGSYAKNQTKKSIVSGTMYSFLLNLSDGAYSWTCAANKTSDSTITYSQEGNFSLYVDTVMPGVAIQSVATTDGSQTITFNAAYTDTNPLTCKYTILNSSGSTDGLNNNVSYICNSPTDATVTAFGSYTLVVYAADPAGNENSSSYPFSVDQSSGNGGGGGGGGGGVQIIREGGGTLATNFSIMTENHGDFLDFVIAKGSVRPRSKNLIIVNKGVDPITLNIVCDSTSQNLTQDIDPCAYVDISDKTVTVSPNEQQVTTIQISVMTPPGADYGDSYGYNILAIHYDAENTTPVYSKVSISNRVTYIGSLFKWDYVPFQDTTTLPEDKNAYPVTPVSFFIAFLLFLVIFIIGATTGYVLTGFLVGMPVSIISFFVLVLLL